MPTLASTFEYNVRNILYRITILIQNLLPCHMGNISTSVYDHLVSNYLQCSNTNSRISPFSILFLLLFVFSLSFHLYLFESDIKTVTGSQLSDVLPRSLCLYIRNYFYTNTYNIYTSYQFITHILFKKFDDFR